MYSTSNSATYGEFNPREYKNTEQDWAKRRKPEYMSAPGTVTYSRQVVQQSNDELDAARRNLDRFARQDAVQKYRQEQGLDDFDETFQRNIQIQQQQIEDEYFGGQNSTAGKTAGQPTMVPIPIQRVEKNELWPRRTRSDITANYR